MSATEVIPELGNLAEQPEPSVERCLSLVPGGLGEITLVPEESKDSKLGLKNRAYLDRLGVDIDISDSSRAQISLGEGQESLACALLYGLEITGWQHYPSRVPIFRPDIYEATNLLLGAKESGGEQAYSFSDGELAVGYDSSGNAVFIKNIIKKGPGLNGLEGAPKYLLETVLGNLDLETAAAEIGPPLALERSRYNNHNPKAISRP